MSAGASVLFLIVAGLRVCGASRQVRSAIAFMCLLRSPHFWWRTFVRCVREPWPAALVCVRLWVILNCRPGVHGVGSLVYDALVSRYSVSVSLAFFGVRRAARIAAHRQSDVSVTDSAGVIELKIRCRENDLLGAGHMAHVAAAPAWGGTCPVFLMSARSRFGARTSRNRDRENRTSASDECVPLSVGLARARFGGGMAPSGVTASWAKGFEGKDLSPRRVGARLNVVDGMAR